MSKLKLVGYKAFAQKLTRAGYIPIRKRKHVIYYHPEKQITIPLPHKHPRDISKGFLHRLIKEMKISLQEFNTL